MFLINIYNKRFSFILTMLILFFSSNFLFAQLLDPSTQTKFSNSLPVIKDLGLRVDLTKGANINVQMVETTQDLGLQGVTGYTGSTV
ncbi:MAG: hypothetical protein P8Z35_05780, partial [Ignavibacteriaceae bacterium]